MTAEAPTITPAVTPTIPMSKARKVMLAALILGFLSLFGHYGGTSGTYLSPAVPGTTKTATFYNVDTPGVVGYKYYPKAPYVIVGLLVVFGTAMHTLPFWRRYGYWLAFALFFWAVFIGLAPGSGLGIWPIPWLMIGAAAYINGKSRNTESAPAST
jgi:hypothetical protein